MKPNPCKRHSEGPWHDCDYVEWRTLLVPIAATMATRQCPDDSRKWDVAFHAAMSLLTSDPFVLKLSSPIERAAYARRFAEAS
jgi:DNA-binding FadR family transcriptional regulator